jgi:hypothetical protein
MEHLTIPIQAPIHVALRRTDHMDQQQPNRLIIHIQVRRPGVHLYRRHMEQQARRRHTIHIPVPQRLPTRLLTPMVNRDLALTITAEGQPRKQRIQPIIMARRQQRLKILMEGKLSELVVLMELALWQKLLAGICMRQRMATYIAIKMDPGPRQIIQNTALLNHKHLQPNHLRPNLLLNHLMIKRSPAAADRNRPADQPLPVKCPVRPATVPEEVQEQVPGVAGEEQATVVGVGAEVVVVAGVGA